MSEVKDSDDPRTPVDKAIDILASRQQAYQNTFGGQFGKDVLADLASFCRANETTFHPDQRVHAVLEGRREVWLRIEAYIKLDSDSLAKRFLKKGAME